ncbi:MAG: hypothetical protein ABSG17_08185 [Spirochaetia bacterium]
MQQQQGKNNARNLFGSNRFPPTTTFARCWTQWIPPLLNPVHQKCFDLMQQRERVQPMRSFGNSLLVALDGTG